MTVTERFLKYVKVHTASSETSDSVPSSLCQFDLAKILEKEMQEIGLEKVCSDEYAYVYGELPATEGKENEPAIAFVAHIDTIPDFSGENVNPQVISDYDGKNVKLGNADYVLDTAFFTHLPALKGQTLITTDGTTVLGADDKAGVAEIMTAFAEIVDSKVPHGRIVACFTPDEEIGHGAALMNLESVNADFAYTVDGGEPYDINYETFNAAEAEWDIQGFNIHPGDAKNKMINAALVAMEINSMLPSADVPSKTENYEGFFHLYDITGTVEKAKVRYIVRDHDAALFEGRIKMLRHIEDLINEKYGEGTAILTVHEQYRNMAELVRERFEIVERAERAIRKEGLIPVTSPVRGGTDGSQLSFRGLLCPNLGTGGYACHGPCEHITSERMEQCVRIIKNIITD